MKNSRRSGRGGGDLKLAVLFAVVLALLVGACDAAAPGGSAPTLTNTPAATTGSTVGGGDSSGGGGESTASPSVAAPSATSSAVASPSLAPAGDYDPAKFGFAAKGLRGEVMAFVTTSQVDDAIASLDFGATSTIAFFSLVAGSNGSINQDTRWRSWTGPSSTS